MTVLGQLGIGCYTIVVASVLSVLEVSCNSSGIFKYFQCWKLVAIPVGFSNISKRKEVQSSSDYWRVKLKLIDHIHLLRLVKTGERGCWQIPHNQAKIFALAIP